MKRKICVIAMGVFLLFSGSLARAYTYSFTAGSESAVNVTPLSGAQSAVDYYSLYSSSGHPAFGAKQKRAFFWLWEDTETDEVSLNVIFSKENKKKGGAGKANFKLSGLPTGWSWALQDDNGDIGGSQDLTPTWEWNSKNTDGGIIEGLENEAWDITWDPSKLKGIQSWYFVSGDASDKYANPFSLKKNADLTVSAKNNTISSLNINVVPEPSTLVLLGAGLLGLGILARMRRT
jgi:PEP-CTERM motif